MHKRIFNILTVYILIISLLVVYLPVHGEKMVNEAFTGAEEVILNEEDDKIALTPEQQIMLDEINNEAVIYETQENEPTYNQITAESNTTFGLSPVESEEEFKEEPINSVYNFPLDNGSYVSLASGNLTYEKTLLSLPGRNGLDLNLSVVYNSQDAIVSNNEYDVGYAGIYKINMNSFAPGWNFGFPDIKTEYSGTSRYSQRKYKTLSFPDGSGYKIIGDSNYISEETTLTLEDYKLSDCSLVRKTKIDESGETVAGDYVLTYDNGTIYTFDGTYGNLTEIKDIYGNTIKLEYEKTDYFRGTFTDYIFTPSYYMAEGYVLSKITDSAGRIININYVITNEEKGTSVKEINVKIGGTQYALIKLNEFKTSEGTVDVVTHIYNGDELTQYNYDDKSTHLCLRSYDSFQQPSYNEIGCNILLTKITTPLGGEYIYEYTKARRRYSYLDEYDSTAHTWYEIYKASKITMPSGLAYTYEYINDQSGYPDSYLDVSPVGEWRYSSDYYTGYIADESFQYSCIVSDEKNPQ